MVPSMHCAGCIRTLEKGLAAHSDVVRVRANLSLKQIDVVWTGDAADADEMARRIADLGFDAMPVEKQDDADAKMRRQGRHLMLCLAVAGFASANIMLLSVSVWSGAQAETAKLFALLSGVIAVPAIIFAGSPFFSSAIAALRKRQLNMDVPISLAVLLSLLMSLYEALIGGGETFFDAGVMLLFFLLIGRTLDQLMREKAAGGVRSLARLIPQRATRVAQDGSLSQINLDEVETGMVLRLSPGDRFPVNAKILAGSSAVDRSVVTGEADQMPISEGQVFEAGTLNLNGSLDVEAVSDAQSSFLAEVMDMMRAAETSKGRYRRIADRMASIYAPAVHLLALITLAVWMLATGDFKSSLTAAIAVLIITCPCALGLAVPVTHVVAANRLFREGILMRDGSALERLAEADTVFFDKTGTLTSDRLRLDAKPSLSIDHASVLASLAARSNHPAARAIADAYSHEPLCSLDDVQEVAGSGIEATWHARRIRLGRATWVRELASGSSGNDSAPTCFAIEGEASFGFRLSADLNPGAAAAVQRVTKLGRNTAILSGDHQANVRAVADRLGIACFYAGLMPRGKIAKIEEAAASDKVLMVGDGLNDAPSLAAAHVSMAPANATDVSRASADFIYTRPSLLAVPFAMRLARAANRVVRQNFGIAIVYNCIAVPMAMLGHVTPLVAAIAMSLSSIIVVSNSLRLAFFDRLANAPKRHLQPAQEGSASIFSPAEVSP
ncbi:MAG: heavy metal translocating P-type ATPase [Ahrensia sp.]|nr:heavy metal translocating P-type ATPase [Ahrensia sp.]